MPPSAKRRKALNLTTEELSESTWGDFESLFERNGGVWGGCWCTFYQAPRGAAWASGDGNRDVQRDLLHRGRSHGLLVKDGELTVGWCQFGPKADLPRIDGRKGYAAPEESGMWRMTCFFVDKAYRKAGVATLALGEALKVMERSNVRLVEAYPVESGRKASATLLWSGTPQLFSKFGFKKVKKLGKSSWVMQRRLGPAI